MSASGRGLLQSQQGAMFRWMVSIHTVDVVHRFRQNVNDATYSAVLSSWKEQRDPSRPWPQGPRTACFKGFPWHLTPPLSSAHPSWVLILHSRPLCMNVNRCTESMHNRIINHVFHGLFQPWAMQGSESECHSLTRKRSSFVLKAGFFVFFVFFQQNVDDTFIQSLRPPVWTMIDGFGLII